MSKTPSWRLFFIVFGCFSFMYVGLAYGQDVSRVGDDDLLTKREALQQRLLELQLSIGRYDPALVETLSSLAASSASLNLYSEASALLDRSLQIQRVNYGLLAQEQIPLVLAKIDLAVFTGDWETVNSTISYLEWLLIEKNVTEADALIQHLTRLSELHLKGVKEDVLERRAFHYQQASKYIYQALSVGKRFWGPRDVRLINLYYSLVKQFYLQSAAVERNDETAYALRAIVPGSTWVKPRRIVQSKFYQAGLSLLSDMREIVQYSMPQSRESLAMVELYIADWHLIFDKTIAVAAYRNAFVELSEANVDLEELDLLFGEPRILPVPNFHAEISDAIAANDFSESGSRKGLSKPLHLQLDFQEWSESMSLIQKSSTMLPEASSKQSGSTPMQLHFCLNALDKVSHWVRGRYRTNLSVPNGFRESESDHGWTINRKFIDDHFSLLHFRPRLKAGIAQRSGGVLLFQAALN